MTPLRIVIVDDHVMLRDGIVSILQKEADFDVVGEAGSVASAISTIKETAPDLVLMDYGLPDGNGLDATREILAMLPATNVVLLTVHEEDDLLFSAIRSGAKGYLLKYISAKDLLAALRNLVHGDAALLPTERRRILSEFAKTDARSTPGDDNLPDLTTRELEVLKLIENGATNREIALDLSISPYTVKNHIHNILDKLSVSDRREAAAIAVRRGLIDHNYH